MIRLTGLETVKSGEAVEHRFLSSPNMPAYSVRRSSPRTAKRPRTGPDWTDLGPDCSPGPTLVLSGPVLVLKILWDVKDQSWTSPDRS